MNIVQRGSLCTAMAIAPIGLAALSDQYAAFGKGPALFVMTPEELSTWKAVDNDIDAKEFIEQFWARRDPAFHVRFDQAVAYADQKLTSRKRRGAMTDMGKVLVILGPPTRQREFRASAGELPPLSPSEADIRAIGRGKVRCWVYEAKVPKVPRSDATEVCFDDRQGNGDWLLLAGELLGPLFERVNRSRLLPAVSPTARPTSVPTP